MEDPSLQMEAGCSSKTSENFHQNTWRHIKEEYNAVLRTINIAVYCDIQSEGSIYAPSGMLGCWTQEIPASAI
jgi:hypothetical protein